MDMPQTREAFIRATQEAGLTFEQVQERADLLSDQCLKASMALMPVAITMAETVRGMIAQGQDATDIASAAVIVAQCGKLLAQMGEAASDAKAMAATLQEQQERRN